MWPEIKKVLDRNLKELLLDGEEISGRIERKGIDETLFTLVDLNFLRLTNTCLQSVDSRIANLAEKLTNLDLSQNQLSDLPTEIGQLTQIKTLNLSGNKLSTVPTALCQLSGMLTLNLSHNDIESLPDVSGLTNLHELFVHSNKLTSLPEGITELEELLTIQADHNAIVALPDDIDQLAHLKSLHLAHNSLKDLPPSLILLDKLRILDLRGNTGFSDQRLFKLTNVDQTQPKAVFKYLMPLYRKQVAGSKKGASSRSNNADGSDVMGDGSDKEDEDHIQVLSQTDSRAMKLQVIVSESVSEVRPYIICCILRNVKLDASNTTLKKFIALQTALHEGICEKRMAATIATHDMACVKSPLTFDALNPVNTMLVPLGRHKAVSASEFMVRLEKEADERRRAKKRNTKSGIHKYLDLLKDKTLYPFLVDREQAVISFPPMSNSDITKVTAGSKDILVEVTSNKSLTVCKNVMEQVILEAFRLGIGQELSKQSSSGAAAHSDDSSDEEGDSSHCLVVEQVKTTDKDGNFKSMYPSKTDLIDIPISVRRE